MMFCYRQIDVNRISHCEMNWKFASAILVIVCWLNAGLANIEQASQPVIFTTAPKIIKSQLKLADGANLHLIGSAALTITRANEDDSMTGVLVYTLTDEERHKIADRSGKALSEIPANTIQRNLTVNFQRNTACPLIKVKVAINEVDFIDTKTKLSFDNLVLDIFESQGQLNQLFCSWTRQINVNRQRLGIIAAINRLIAPEKDEVENETANP